MADKTDDVTLSPNSLILVINLTIFRHTSNGSLVQAKVLANNTKELSAACI